MSALCGIAGSYAEHNIVFHIVGMPAMTMQEKHAIVHHTLGNGEFNQFMAMAAPNRRVVLITGEGSHQMTAQEISQFYRYGLKPIIFVLNNHGYLIERMLSKKLDYYYNELAEWQYHKLPEVLGCNDWVIRKTTTCGDLDKIMDELENTRTGAYYRSRYAEVLNLIF